MAIYNERANELLDSMLSPCRCKVTADDERVSVDTIGCDRHRGEPVAETARRVREHVERLMGAMRVPAPTFRGIPAPTQPVAVRRCQNHNGDVEAGRVACEWCGYRWTTKAAKDCGSVHGRGDGRIRRCARDVGHADHTCSDGDVYWHRLYGNALCRHGAASWHSCSECQRINPDDADALAKPTRSLLSDAALEAVERIKPAAPSQPAPRPGQTWRDPSGENGTIYDVDDVVGDGPVKRVACVYRIRMASALRVEVLRADLLREWTFVDGPTVPETPAAAFDRVLAMCLADRPDRLTEREWLVEVGRIVETIQRTAPAAVSALRIRTRQRCDEMSAEERAKR